nr:MAG TPA: DNA N-6-adenine-methyltransferase [Caudoviricetes sp.]
MMTKGMYTSNSEEWGTPQELFNRLNEEFNFTLDICASEENAKCPKYYTKEEDALKQEWGGVIWMNPPYGRRIGNWVKKAKETARQGKATVVCLLPARTDTAWWHDYVMKANEIRLIRGRLKFGDGKGSAPFPSAIVVFKKGLASKIQTNSCER